jgi:hypothetical protein
MGQKTEKAILILPHPRVSSAKIQFYQTVMFSFENCTKEENKHIFYVCVYYTYTEYYIYIIIFSTQ